MVSLTVAEPHYTVLLTGSTNRELSLGIEISIPICRTSEHSIKPYDFGQRLQAVVTIHQL